MTTNARERVIAAFRHEEPDRTPFFERLIKSPAAEDILGRPSILNNIPYRMGVLAEASWEEIVEMEARETFDLARTLGFDMIRLGTNMGRDFQRPKKLAPNTWQIGDRIAEYLETSDVLRWHPLKEESIPEDEQERRRLEELETPLDKPGWNDDSFRVWRRVMQLCQEHGIEPAVYCSNYAMPVATLPPYMFRWFRERPEALHKFYERCSQHAIWVGERYAEEGADVIGLGGDLADDQGPMISPRDYWTFVGSRIRVQARTLKRRGVFVTNTTDGNLWSMLDEFLVKTEVNGYGEIDKAAGMDLRRLKRAHGKRICFLGNLDVRRVLCSGSPEDARREMIDCIEAGRGGGGHVIMTSNCVHRDVKTANYLAAVNAYRDYFGLT